MVTIREEQLRDAVAREVLLDEAYGSDRFTKMSARLREGRLPAAGLSLVAVHHGRLVGTVRRAEADPESPEGQVACRQCGAPLNGREGHLVLKYFLVD